MSAELFYIVDVRPEWKKKPYITVWRPKNCGYAYPLSWAGKYDKATIDARIDYYLTKEGKRYVRFPVPCSIVERFGVAPEKGKVDGDTGPVIPNHGAIIQTLLEARYDPYRD